jgi:flagellar protein FliJ
MAKFVFKLEAVLRQRRTEERDQQLAVAQIERARLSLESQLRGIQGTIVAEREELRLALTSKRVGFSDIRLQAGTESALRRQAQRLVLELAGVHKRLDRAREKLVRASARRKAIERLRERRYEAWAEDRKRKEAASLDELNITHAQRKEILS